MSLTRVLVLALTAALLSAPAYAQDEEDDELAPLTPKAKPKPKPKPKPAVKPPVVKPKPPVASDDELAPLTPQKGELVIKLAATTNTRKAKVSIDDKEIGVLPLSPQSLSPGEHSVTVRAPGYAPWTRKVTVTANKPTELSIALDATAAFVSVTSDTQGAEVVINGKLAGYAPIEEIEVAPGTATIVVRKEGHREASQTIKLVVGKEYPISVKLGAAGATTAIVANTDRPVNTTLTPEPVADVGIDTSVESSPPIYTRWYFWAGAAAVVAAVAVGTAVGVSSSKPKTLGEQEICGGKCDACIGFACASGALKF